MSVRVVDLNNEGGKEEPPALEAIEEAKEEARQSPATSREAPEPPEPEIVNEVVEEVNEEPKDEVKEEKPKRQTQKDKMTCPKCFKEVSIKTYKYSHEKNCQGQLQDRPVKKQAKPKAKQQPKLKPPPEVYYSDEEEEEEHKPLSKPVRNQILKPQPINPQTALAQHYQLLQQAFIKQKQEKYNNLCMNMFSTKTKKR